MAKSRTLYDKIWDDHVIDEQPDGTCLIYIDRHLVHEVTSPQAFEGLRARDLVHQMAINIEKAGSVRLFVDQMVVPDLVVECTRLRHFHHPTAFVGLFIITCSSKEKVPLRRPMRQPRNR